jgi:sulfur-carrier protein adenylyltransferase/sulfurtransferase
MPLTPSERERFSRHLALREVGVEGQEKLKAAKVLVVGAGGLGSPSILYLAAAGIGTIGIVDCDTVDISNLQRQILFDSASIGEPKAEAAAARLKALNPDLRVNVHQTELRAANVLSTFADYDLVLDGTDRFATRYLTNDACVILGKPLVSAAIHRFEGQAMTYVPTVAPCYRCLFPKPPSDGSVPNCAEAGVLGVLPGVLGTLQATEAIKLVTGIGEPLLGRLLTYDALSMRFEEFRFSRRSDCAVCGDRPTIKTPEDPPELCSADVLQKVRRLTAPELLKELASGSVTIVDVREPHEYGVRHLDAAINIPVGHLMRRFKELPTDRTLVFVCRSGSRSQTACALAAREGATSLAHLEGGLLAWARDVDTAFAVASV